MTSATRCRKRIQPGDEVSAGVILRQRRRKPDSRIYEWFLQCRKCCESWWCWQTTASKSQCPRCHPKQKRDQQHYGFNDRPSDPTPDEIRELADQIFQENLAAGIVRQCGASAPAPRDHATGSSRGAPVQESKRTALWADV